MDGESVSSLIFAQNPVAACTEILSRFGNEASTSGKNRFSHSMHGSLLPGLASLTTVDDLVAAFVSLEIPGPLTLHSRWDHETHLGRGAQFLVTSGDVLFPEDCQPNIVTVAVAVKWPLFRHNEDGALDLASARCRQQIHDIYLEVSALSRRSLLGHRNIVRLLGWGTDGTWINRPLLVLELAFADLRSIFSRTHLSQATMQQLSIDVGQGLDAIHDAGIIHGDLKTQNILVFTNGADEVPYIAKLADFGLCVNNNTSTSDDFADVVGMSSEWSAPEVNHGARLTAAQLVKTDSFSYGMVIWSIHCLQGSPPPSKLVDKAIESVDACSHEIESLTLRLKSALTTLLTESATLRPDKVGDAMMDNSAAAKHWRDDECSWACREDSAPKHGRWTGYFPWQPVSIAPLLFLGLEACFSRNKASLTGRQLLSMVLALTYRSLRRSSKSLQIEVLQAAVSKGSAPAKGILARLCQSYGMQCETNGYLLRDAAETGAVLAFNDLYDICPDDAEAALAYFRKNQGYNRYYSPLRSSGVCSPNYQDEDANSCLHIMAAQGLHESLDQVLHSNSPRLLLNHRNAYGETALYKACLAGSWQATLILCEFGADASVRSRMNGLTCLHWLFNFPFDQIPSVLTALLKANADINALAEPVPWIANFHFPFSWPPGAPLHWAIFTSRYAAVTELLLKGANPNIRDGRDAYIADDKVRVMDVHDNPEAGEYSEPEEEPSGFSAIDLATALHDVQALKLLRRYSTYDLVLGEDEEGYTPLHRLSHFRMSRTSNSLRFWYPAFTGSSNERSKRVMETVEELIDMGADINKLTKTPREPGRMLVSGLTPLMIAVAEADDITTAALLKCGADPDATNRDGSTALMLMSDRPHDMDDLIKIIGLLIEHRADINRRTNDGKTALWAAIKGPGMFYKYLIESHAELQTAVDGITLMAELLFNKSHAMSMQDTVETRLSISESQAQDAYLAQLISSQSGLNQWAHSVDKDNGSLLHYAAGSGLLKCTEVLLAAGLNVNQIRKLHFDGPMPPNSYSLVSKFIGEGTTLDALIKGRDRHLSNTRPTVAQSVTRAILEQYQATERLLRANGAVKAGELRE